MRRALAALITLAVGGVVLWSGWRRPDRSAAVSSENVPPGMQAGPAQRLDVGKSFAELAGAAERIEDLLDCARRGNVKGYLSAFRGPIRSRLEQQVEEKGLEAFAGELRRAGRLRKSYAVYAAEPTAPYDTVQRDDSSVRENLTPVAAQLGDREHRAERDLDAVRTSRDAGATNPIGKAVKFARVTVEAAFADRIERQAYILELGDAGWLVTEVESPRDQVPKNPLGSLATFHEPEGVPVPWKD